MALVHVHLCSRSGVYKLKKNYLRKTRKSLLISKAELARKANISPATITRIENGKPCRLDTKRKILLALGLKISDKNKIFYDDLASNIKDNGRRRSKTDRRQFNYYWHIPDKRSGKERRSGNDRRVKPRTNERIQESTDARYESQNITGKKLL